MVLGAGGHDIVGTYIDPREPLAQPEGALDPDVIILDERLGGNSGLAYFRAYRKKFPKAKLMREVDRTAWGWVRTTCGICNSHPSLGNMWTRCLLDDTIPP